MDFKRAGVWWCSVLRAGAEGPPDTPEVMGQTQRGRWSGWLVWLGVNWNESVNTNRDVPIAF